MQLNLNLSIESDKKTVERVQEAVNRKKKAAYEPTWQEVWETGYPTTTGKHKAGIFQTKLTEKDRDKLLEVKEAIEQGQLETGVDSTKKITKSRMLALYKDLLLIKRDSIIKQMVKNKPANYILVDHTMVFDNMLFNLSKEKLIGLDTETTGVEYFGKDYIVGFSMSLDDADMHYYVPIRHNLHDGEKQLDDHFVLNKIKPFIEDEKIKKVLHNAKFDIHMFYKEGIDLKGLLMDTMVAMHVLNENEPSYALKNLATKYGKFFGFEDKSDTYEMLFGKGGFENTPLDIGTVYACKDTHLTLKFYKWIQEQLEKRPALYNVYYGIEQETTAVCVEMERNGFMLDMDFATEYCEKLKSEIAVLEKEIAKTFGGININSNQQLASKLYDEWGLTDVSKSRKVNAETLKQLAEECTGITLLLEYREKNKLLSTYIEPLPQKVSSMDGRLHGQFNQSATATGRFASSNPNLQNLPYDARKMIVAPAGKIIIGIDYSQIEPRFLSHISKDPIFKRPYVEGGDLYSEIASKVFKVPIEMCGDGSKYRKQAKVVLLGMMYGISAYSMSKTFKITPQEAEQLYEDFYGSYLGVADFIKGTQEKADTLGYVETFTGRKRRFLGHVPIANRYKALHSKIKAITGKEKFNVWQEKKVPRELKQAYWEIAGDYGRVNRQSVNAVIQGSSADIMKLAMIKLYKFLKNTKGDEYKMLATIHDEVLIEVPADITAEEIEELENCMKTAVTLDVPFKVDTEISKRWGAGCPKAQYLSDRTCLD